MEVHLVDGTYELFRHYFAVPSSKATASSTGLGRDIRPSSPTVSIPIAQ